MTPNTTKTPNNDGAPSAVPTHSVPTLVAISDLRDHLNSVDAQEKKYPDLSDVDLLAEANACHTQIIANRAVIAKALADTVVMMHRAGRAMWTLYTRHSENPDLWSFILKLIEPATIEDLIRCREIDGKHFKVLAIADLNVNQLFRAAMIFPKKKGEEQ